MDCVPACKRWKNCHWLICWCSYHRRYGSGNFPQRLWRTPCHHCRSVTTLKKRKRKFSRSCLAGGTSCPLFANLPPSCNPPPFLLWSQEKSSLSSSKGPPPADSAILSTWCLDRPPLCCAPISLLSVVWRRWATTSHWQSSTIGWRGALWRGDATFFLDLYPSIVCSFFFIHLQKRHTYLEVYEEWSFEGFTFTSSGFHKESNHSLNMLQINKHEVRAWCSFTDCTKLMHRCNIVTSWVTKYFLHLSHWPWRNRVKVALSLSS